MNLSRLSKKIARDLFTDGHGNRATRLVMEFGGKQDGCGWAEFAVADRVLLILEKALKKLPCKLSPSKD